MRGVGRNAGEKRPCATGREAHRTVMTNIYGLRTIWKEEASTRRDVFSLPTYLYFAAYSKNTVGVSKQRKSFSNLAVCGHEQTKGIPFFLKNAHFLFTCFQGHCEDCMSESYSVSVNRHVRSSTFHRARVDLSFSDLRVGIRDNFVTFQRALQMLKLCTQKTLQKQLVFK